MSRLIRLSPSTGRLPSRNCRQEKVTGFGPTMKSCFYYGNEKLQNTILVPIDSYRPLPTFFLVAEEIDFCSVLCEPVRVLRLK